jgi:HK97 family phage major capsid protein/HK97 family phage prohead protease
LLPLSLRERSPFEETGDNTIFSFSSEYPVDRGWGVEILDHALSSVDLSRMATANLLLNHDRSIILGAIERVWIDSVQKKGYCKIRWSNRSEVQGYKEDVANGIIRNVSFGYNVLKTVPLNDKGSYRVTKWQPFEVSLVSVPADYTVGFGRAKGFEGTISLNVESCNMDRELEKERILGIQELVRSYGFPELGQRAIEEDMDIEDARSLYLARLGEQMNPVAGAVNPLGLSTKEGKSYSILRAINACLTNDWTKAGFERECSREIAKRAGKETSGFFLPVRDVRMESYRATYQVGTAATGGNTVETSLMAENFIDVLRNKLVIRSLGATVMSGLQGNVDIPGQDAITQTYWVGESGAITQSEATFRQVPLRPRTIAARSQMSRLMLLQSSIDIEQFVRNDFAAVMARGIDQAAIRGTGTNGEPRGILNLTGIGTVALGTNGGAPTYSSIIALMRELEIDNADMGALSWLTNPLVKSRLMLTPKQASGVEGNFILSDPGRSLMGYQFACTNAVPSNLTKGTGTNLSPLIFGNFNDLIIGEWGSVEILVNPYGAGYNTGDVDIRVMQTIDVAFRQVVSFAAITDMITTLP